MHILFLTSTSLTTNPRLLKEIKVALDAQIKVSVVLFELGHWTTAIENELISKLSGVTVTRINVTREELLPWIKATSLSMIFKKISPLLRNSLKLTSFASDKRSLLLYNKLQKIPPRYDLVIAHNLGALYPAYNFSKQHRIPFIFDVEDYHPGEIIHQDSKEEKIRRETLMRGVLPKTTFITAASPHIAEEVEKLTGTNAITINNSFFSSEFIQPIINKSQKVSFVWFSQNINYGRGLELILPVLDRFNTNIKLTLIGHTNQSFANEWLTDRDYVEVIQPLPQELLHQKLSEFDIGLALELTIADLNKDLALSNKIFAYKQAGLYILATDTKGQKAFMEKYRSNGYTIQQDLESVQKGLEFIFHNIEEIRAKKIYRFEQAKNIAFEREAERLVNLWRLAAD